MRRVGPGCVTLELESSSSQAAPWCWTLLDPHTTSGQRRWKSGGGRQARKVRHLQPQGTLWVQRLHLYCLVADAVHQADVRQV